MFEKSPKLPANVRVRVRPNINVHVKRRIQGAGKIQVIKNQEVKPEDILGVSSLSAGFSSINLAKKLLVSPSEAVKFLQKPIGAKIFEGELLAEKKSIIGNAVVTSPTDGVIEDLNIKTGELKLKFLPKNIPVTSGVYGIVDDVDSLSGDILIKTIVTKIYGVAGTGTERSGILNTVGTAGSLLHSSQITPNMNKRIVVAGAFLDAEALKKAAGFGINGIISGGMNEIDFLSVGGSLARNRVGNDVGMSILSTEGFGPITMGEDIFNLLRQYEGKHVFLNGNTAEVLLPSGNSDSILSLRKVALPVTTAPLHSYELKIGDVEIGKKVRIIWPPFMGAQGKVVEIDKTGTALESGVNTIMITVETPRQKIKVPYPNIEIIE